MSDVPLRRMKRSRRPVKGDLFRLAPLALDDGMFLGGWVLDDDSSLFARDGGGLVICVFAPLLSEGQPVTIGRPLLVAPTLTNQRGWTLGFFAPAGHIDVSTAPAELVPELVFRVPWTGEPEAGQYVDSRCRPVPEPPSSWPPASWAALRSVESIADTVADAL